MLRAGVRYLRIGKLQIFSMQCGGRISYGGGWGVTIFISSPKNPLCLCPATLSLLRNTAPSSQHCGKKVTVPSVSQCPIRGTCPISGTVAKMSQCPLPATVAQLPHCPFRATCPIRATVVPFLQHFYFRANGVPCCVALAKINLVKIFTGGLIKFQVLLFLFLLSRSYRPVGSPVTNAPSRACKVTAP